MDVPVWMTLVLAVHRVIVVPEAFRLSGILFDLKIFCHLKKIPAFRYATAGTTGSNFGFKRK